MFLDLVFAKRLPDLQYIFTDVRSIGTDSFW